MHDGRHRTASTRAVVSYSLPFARAVTGECAGDGRVLERIREVVAGLREVQDALGGSYLSAFPSEHFDRQALEGVWAPYYVVRTSTCPQPVCKCHSWATSAQIHKLMAGLLDVHTRVGHHRTVPALEMLRGMAHYFGTRVNATLDANGTAHWQAMLGVEFGGMGEVRSGRGRGCCGANRRSTDPLHRSQVLYKLYAATGDPAHRHLADCFQKNVFVGPLHARQDRLAGNHVNTHLTQVRRRSAAWACGCAWSSCRVRRGRCTSLSWCGSPRGWRREQQRCAAQTRHLSPARAAPFIRFEAVFRDGDSVEVRVWVRRVGLQCGAAAGDNCK